MGRYNVNFELSVDDMDLIESALRRSKSDLSTSLMTEDGSIFDVNAANDCADGEDRIRRIHDLLGRLHNQKVFYRPRSTPYISG